MAAALRGQLRIITCGSVDDGKSTLIGRLLFDAGAVPEDTVQALIADSRRHGTTGHDIDFALLCDGLAAEREQGITIDVAYRYFSGPTRKYILADTPGHQMFTRNMVTAASTADAAILLVDARKGLLPQTQRHAMIAKLAGVRRIVLAVNKMDLVGWSEATFNEIQDRYAEFARSAGLPVFTAIPMAARHGDNIVQRSERSAWWRGAPLLDHLETLVIEGDDATERPGCLPVQWVCRPNEGFRGYAGTIGTGQLCVGQSVRILPAGPATRIAGISTPSGEATTAYAGEAVMVTLADEVALRRGEWLVAAEAHDGKEVEVSDLLHATLVWMTEEPLAAGRPYILRLGPTERTATIVRIRHALDVTTLAKTATRELGLNEIGECEISLNAPCPFLPYDVARDLGGFVLIDRLSAQTVAAGMIQFGLRRASNVIRQQSTIDGKARASLKGQRACCVWMTGLSGAGKSTIGNCLEQRLYQLGRHSYMLDGDNVRHGLNRDLGFTPADRIENVRRLAEASRLMVDAGLITIVAAISPYRVDRESARGLFEEGEFIEVFVDSPVEVCSRRDVKGLYAKAQQGLIPNFTGISAPYECPDKPDIHLRSDVGTPERLADLVIEFLQQRGMI